MAQRARNGVRQIIPNTAILGGAATGVQRRFSWIWSAESIFRMALALVLAVVLWLYITSKQNPSYIDFSQPISVTTQNLPTGQLTVTNALQSVHVRYHTSNANTYVAPGNFHAFVNLFGLRAGSWPHVKVHVVADPGIQVVKVSPPFIPVKIEVVAERRVPVSTDFRGSNLPPGYQIGTPSLSPNVVTVKGPHSLVSQITQASVDINLAGAQTSIQETQNPLPEDSQGTPVTASSVTLTPAEVQVTVPIRAIKSFKTVPVIVSNLTGQPKAGYSVGAVAVTPSELTAHGSPKVLDALSAASTFPVSIARLGAGSYSTRVKVHLPKGVSSSIQMVTVTLQLKPVQASTSIQLGVVPLNVTPGLAAQTKPAKVLVTVVGPSTGLRAVGRRMSATVDLTGLQRGFYQLRPLATAPPGFTIENIYPTTVAVTIS